MAVAGVRTPAREGAAPRRAPGTVPIRPASPRWPRSRGRPSPRPCRRSACRAKCGCGPRREAALAAGLLARPSPDRAADDRGLAGGAGRPATRAPRPAVRAAPSPEQPARIPRSSPRGTGTSARRPSPESVAPAHDAGVARHHEGGQPDPEPSSRSMPRRSRPGQVRLSGAVGAERRRIGEQAPRLRAAALLVQRPLQRGERPAAEAALDRGHHERGVAQLPDVVRLNGLAGGAALRDPTGWSRTRRRGRCGPPSPPRSRASGRPSGA